jgi:hypothetical protein
MGRDLVSIGKEPLLLSPPIYSDKKRESSVVGYSILINNNKFGYISFKIVKNK